MSWPLVRYYKDFDLAWLQAGLDAGIQTVSQEQLGPIFGPLSGSWPFREAESSLRTEPKQGRPVASHLLSPKAVALVQAMSNLAPVCPAPDSG